MRKEHELTSDERLIVQEIEQLADSSSGEVLRKESGSIVNSSTGFGDVSGPGSSTDNAIARYDGTGGKTLQNSSATISDTGVVTAGANAASGLDLVTYQQWQDSLAGLSAKDSVRVATTANGTFSTAFQNGATVDGITLVTGNRILIKDQTSQDQNGIYIVEASGAPTRASDANTWDELVSAFTFVEAGSTNADTGWVCTINTGGTLGVDNIAFTQFSSSGTGISSLNGLTATSQTFAVGTSGTDFAISSSSSTHTFNLPDASATNRGAITTGTQTIAGSKTFSSAPTLSSLTASKPLKLNGSNVMTASDINLTNEVTGTLPINRGGTNSASALTNDKAMVSSTGAIVESAVTSTELGYLTGVTSAIQTQLDGKADDGDVTASGLTMSTARLLGRSTAGTGAIEELSSADAFVSAASDTTAGIQENATIAETDTGTSTTRTVTPDALAGSYAGTKSLAFYVTASGTDVATGDNQVRIPIPSDFDGMDLVDVEVFVYTAGTTGTTDIQVHNVTDAVDMLSTKATIDSGETSSLTAATPPVINSANDDVATGDVLRIDVDAVSTTAPQGLYGYLTFRLP